MHRCRLVIIAFFGYAAAIPPPTEYTKEMLNQDLHGARLVARVTVVRIDTSADGNDELATIDIDTVYKGATAAAGDSTLAARRRLNLVGGYAPNYQVGEQSFMCFTDQWQDGATVAANARAKFDITPDDSVEPPPVGLGFSDEFKYARRASAFSRMIQETIRTNEFLSVAPILATPSDRIVLRTSIDLSGGATLEEVTASVDAARNRLSMRLVYTPCTGICPDNLLFLDTSATVAALNPGSYVAYRYKENTLLDEPFVPPDDSVRFRVYQPVSVSSSPERKTVRSSNAPSGAVEHAYDLRGRRLGDVLRRGVYVRKVAGRGEIRHAPAWSERRE